MRQQRCLLTQSGPFKTLSNKLNHLHSTHSGRKDPLEKPTSIELNLDGSAVKWGIPSSERKSKKSLNSLVVCVCPFTMSEMVNTSSFMSYLVSIVFIWWCFGHDLDVLDILYAILLYFVLIFINKCCQRVTTNLLFVMWLSSIAYLLDWNEWWQVWPYPTVLLPIMCCVPIWFCSTQHCRQVHKVA